jgi:HK97 family phage prohead protease
MGEFECRAVLGLEVRQIGGQSPRLRGYAAKFNEHSLDLGGFIEIIRPGAFARSLQGGTEVFAFVEHTPSQIIGRRSRGSLAIGEDAQGLHVEILPPDTQAGRDVIENVRVGNLDAMSFAFRVATNGDKWDMRKDPPLRELLDVNLHEVSVVAMPAYPATEIALRSLREWAHLSGLQEGLREKPRPRTVSERMAWAAARKIR